MASYSMNVGPGGVEQERDCVELGFDNVTPYSRKMATTKPTVPYDKPSAMLNGAIETSNTIGLELGPSAGDITRRNLNG